MVANRGDIFVEGIDVIIKRDLNKHKSLLDKNNIDIQVLQVGRNNEINRKRYYRGQKGKRKFNDNAMEIAIAQMRVNIRQFSDRITITQEQKKQNTIIVDTLTKQLDDYYKSLKLLKN